VDEVLEAVEATMRTLQKISLTAVPLRLSVSLPPWPYLMAQALCRKERVAAEIHVVYALIASSSCATCKVRLMGVLPLAIHQWILGEGPSPRASEVAPNPFTSPDSRGSIGHRKIDAWSVYLPSPAV